MATGVFDLFAKLALDTSQYTSGLTNAKSLAGSIGSGIKKGFTALATAGAAAFTAASAATTKFVKDSVSAGMEFDKSMSQVAATMGKTVDQMMDDVQTATVNGEEFTGNLREYALKMGSETAFSAKQAADALNYMALAGYDTKTSMEMLPNVLNLAAAGTMDLATASDMVTDTQTAFGISLERTSQMVDEMAKAASTGNTSVQQLGDAFLVVGGLASELNGGMVTMADGTKATVDGVQELEIALTAMANAGIKGSEAGTHMRNLIMRLSSPSAEGAKKLEEMGVAVFDAAGNMRSFNDIFTDLNKNLGKMTQEQKITTIGDLFNARDMSSAEALLNAVSQDWDKIGESILNSTYNFSEVNAAIRESGVEWDKYKKTAWMNNGGLQSLTDQIKYNLKDQKLSVEETVDFISSEYDLTMQDAQKAVQAVSDSLSDAKSAAAQMADVQLDNLAGDITLFQSALEGAKIAINDSLSPTLRDFVQYGTRSVSTLSEAFQEGGLTGAIEALQPILQEGIGKVTDLLPTAIQVVSQLLDAVIDNLPSMLETALPEIVNAISSAMSSIAEQLPKLVPIFTKALSAVLKEAPKILDAVLKSIPKLLDDDGGTELLDALLEFTVGVANAFAENIGPIATAFAKAIPNVVNALLDHMDEFINAGNDLFNALLEAFTQEDGVLDAVVNLVTGVLTAITDNIDPILIAFEQLVMSIYTGLSKPETVNKLAESTTRIIAQVIYATASSLGSLSGYFVTLNAQIWKMVNDPKLWLSLGKEVAYGIANGLFPGGAEMFEDFGGMVYDKVQEFKEQWKELWDNAVTAIGQKVTEIKEKWDEFWLNAGQTLIENVESFKEKIASIPEKFAEIITNAKNWGADLVKNFASGLQDNPIVKGTTKIAQTIKDILGFSEPKKGPLSRFHTFAPDMVDLFVSGIEDSQKKVEAALANTFTLPEIDDKNAVKPAKTENEERQQREVVINFTQNNTSPENLNAYEIWRESQRAISMMRMQLQGV